MLIPENSGNQNIIPSPNPNKRTQLSKSDFNYDDPDGDMQDDDMMDSEDVGEEDDGIVKIEENLQQEEDEKT